jgi:hypothetical protein
MEQTTLNNGDENGNEKSAIITRGSRKRKYSPAKMARHQALCDQARIAQQDAGSLENGGLNPTVP